MQRLFSTFPNSWPGCGLLLLRLAGGTPLLCYLLALPASFITPATWLDWASMSGSAVLIPGWWTPIGGALVALAEGWLAIEAGTLDNVHVLRCLIAASLVMLGPGAWSIDARLYGRKRIRVGAR